MTAAILIAKLLEVEKAIGKAHPSTLRHMVLEAQGCVLEMECEIIDTLRDNRRLRERVDGYERNGAVGTRQMSGFLEIAASLSRILGHKTETSEKPVIVLGFARQETQR